MFFLLKFVCSHFLGVQQGLIKNIIFFTAHGAVQIIAFTLALAVFLAVAGGAKNHIHI